MPLYSYKPRRFKRDPGRAPRQERYEAKIPAQPSPKKALQSSLPPSPVTDTGKQDSASQGKYEAPDTHLPRFLTQPPAMTDARLRHARRQELLDRAAALLNDD